MLGAELHDRQLHFARGGVAIESVPADSAEGMWIALAPPTASLQLGEVLGELRAAGRRVHGFVDRAVLLAAATAMPAQVAVLAVARQQLSISMVTTVAGVAALRRHVPLPGGEQALHQAWLALAASTLVQQTRFDPLHDQHHESQLRAQLPQLAATAQQAGQASCEVDTGQATHTLTLTRDQFAVAGQPVLQPLAMALQALSAASEECTLLLPAWLSTVPGFDAAVAAARFSRVLCFDAGLVASAASLLATGPAPSAEGSVPYRTQLPGFAVPLQDVLSPLVLATAGPHTLATHVVYRGRVLPIPPAGLVIGRDPGVDALQLPEGVAGVSRRHCTLRLEGGRAQIIDHSTHGSFLDGVRVRGRAWLAAGSVLRLGDPGIELPLVALHAQA